MTLLLPKLRTRLSGLPGGLIEPTLEFITEDQIRRTKARSKARRDYAKSKKPKKKSTKTKAKTKAKAKRKSTK